MINSNDIILCQNGEKNLSGYQRQMDPVFFINDVSGYGHIADIQDYGDLFNAGDAVGGIFHPADGRRQWRRRERECRIIQKI